MDNIKVYGNYYKLFKGNGGIPEKITVTAIDGDIVTFVRGHYNKGDLENMSLLENKCNIDKIITTITPKQKSIIDKEDKEIQEIVDKADRALEKFKN
ncbi:MAG: hypothetical protein SOW32_05310 [Agathobacter sp.]|nr:hypothetical protein [Agathobacter sp.]